MPRIFQKPNYTHASREPAIKRRIAKRCGMTSKIQVLRNRLIATLLLIASSVVGLALVEGMVRLFFPAYDPSGQVRLVVGANGLKLGPTNQTLRQSKNTGDYDVAVRFNTHGFRDAKDVATARSGDIIVVGDSFAFGYGVEESQRFSNLLQNLVRRRVFNIAIPSADFDDYDNLLKYAESLGSRADDIVIAVCMENDLHLYSESPQSVSNTTDLSDPPLIQIPHIWLTLEGTKAWLTRNSAAYLMFTSAVQQNPMLKNWAVRAHLLVPNLVGIGQNRYSRSMIERSANRLAKIASRYRHTVILIIPSRGLWVGGNRSTEDRVHREFIAALLARHLHVTDMRKIFESGGSPLSNHFRNDGHWNPKGHRSGADALALALAEERSSATDKTPVFGDRR